MKKKVIAVLAVVVIFVAAGTYCYLQNSERGNGLFGNASVESGAISPQEGQILLYGELHAMEAIQNQEFLLWNTYYHEDGMRDLFIEIPYFGAEFLNLWMQSEDDEIIDQLIADWEGTNGGNPLTKEFYTKIKENCPETVFHGTDIGHLYNITGERYLNYLRETGQEDSEEYELTQEAIRQGKEYYEDTDEATRDTYRENKMTENFIREYERLKGTAIMGIYGGAHTDIDGMEWTNGEVPCMANQLEEHYGDLLYTKDMWELVQPLGTEQIQMENKSYDALYYGKSYIVDGKNQYMEEMWMLVDAYEDFEDYIRTGKYMSQYEMPMQIEDKQVFVIDCTENDKEAVREFYCSDGNSQAGVPMIEECWVPWEDR